MKYKGYDALIEYCDESKILHGRIANIADIITFEGNSIAAIEQDFHESVDDYLAFCEEQGDQPNKPYNGKFIVRTTPKIHAAASLAAARQHKSLNAWAAEVLDHAARD